MKTPFNIKQMKIESSELLSKKCKPCEGGVEPLTREEALNYMNGIDGEWELVDNVIIKKIYLFEDYAKTMDFVGKVAIIAEEEGHHPDMCVHYGRVEIELTTHAIKGLSENDFILAAKIDSILKNI